MRKWFGIPYSKVSDIQLVYEPVIEVERKKIVGLALCRRMVSNHHVFIYMESGASQGITSHVLLPLKIR